MSVFVTDTHPLLWFTLNRRANLSEAALRAFSEAEAGNAYIYIPAMVLLEAAILERQRRIELKGGFIRWTNSVLRNSGFGVAQLEPEVINSSVGYSFNKDPFDRVIVATASELAFPLITKDSDITDSALVEILW